MNAFSPRSAPGRLKPVALALLFAMNLHAADKILFDFRTSTNTAAWEIVNDNVMGGVSRSALLLANGVAVFQGEVSLQNNGGFASVRSLPAHHEFAGSDAFLLRVRGDGRSYKFTARTSPSFDTPIYPAVFRTKKGQWEEHRLPLKTFLPSFRGRVLSGQPPLAPEKITSVGFLIADKQAGVFRLEIEWIKAVKLPPSR